MNKPRLLLSLLLLAGSVRAQSPNRLPIIEGFSSATCAPCATWNAVYTPILDANAPNAEGSGEIAVLKFQMNWPGSGDPSYNTEVGTRRNFYGVSSIPDWKIDGDDNHGSQLQIDTYKNIPAKIEIAAAYTITGNTIDVNVAFTPLTNLGGGSRLYIALANKEYAYNGANGETEFHHVFRKMLPTASGISLSFLDSGITQTFHESYTYTINANPSQLSFDFWNDQIEVVVWVQKSNSKEVWNGAIGTQGVLGVAENDHDDFGMMIYPNPLQTRSVVAFDANGSDNIRIKIYNPLGQVVYAENLGKRTGRQRFPLKTTSFDAGMYYLEIVQGNRVASGVFQVVK